MPSEIIIDMSIDETRAALLEDGELAEIYIERSYPKRLVGNIYEGKVSSVLTGMQAAFVDIGYEKNAFLYFGDVVGNREDKDEEDEFLHTLNNFNTAKTLKAGMQIMVQVLKEPFGTKGPRVTTNITLPGRYTVLLPNAEYIGISRRIESEEERHRLKKIVDLHKPPNMGIIVRTAAEGKDEGVLANDIKFLLKLWNKIKQSDKLGPVPRCIHKDLDLVERTVRDMFLQNISRFVINDKSAYLNILEIVDMVSPSLKQKVEFFDRDYDLFGFYNIESKIARALSRKVWLKSGGYIVIDQTEALTVIDVNTGKYIGGNDLEDTVLKTNIEAAKEIARQLRLRDIGGIIIIDFIDMHKVEHQSMVIDELKAALKNDRTKTTVLGLTSLGLVEMTRKKVRQDLDSVLNIGCPHCEGTGRIPSQWTILRQMEKDISRIASHTPHEVKKSIRVDIHPSIVSFINDKNKGIMEKLEKKYNIEIHLNPSDKVKYSDIKITVIDN